MNKEERKEIEHNFRKLQHKLENRLGNLPKHYERMYNKVVNKDIKIPAVESYMDKIISKLPRGTRLSTLSDKELTNMYRDLKYISGLKTASVKGFKQYVDIYLDTIMPNINVMSDKTKDMYWRIYNKLVEQNELLYNYKYEIMDEVMDEVLEGTDEEEIISNIENAYREAYESGKDFAEQLRKNKGFYTSTKLSK